MASLEGTEKPAPGYDPRLGITLTAWQWWRRQLLGINPPTHPMIKPLLKPGDLVFSRYHGFIGGAIALLDIGKRGSWSHISVYHGSGNVAEATSPRGGVNPLRRYMDKKHSLEVWRVSDWSEADKWALAYRMGQITTGKKYDYMLITLHALDFLPSIFGWRPFS